jgi:hypothetical protein
MRRNKKYVEDKAVGITRLDLAQIDISLYDTSSDIRSIRLVPTEPFRPQIGEQVVFKIVGIERRVTEGYEL